jgi:hypothetical protein
MVTDLTPHVALLLHEGGWDEVLMVAIGLGLAYLIIVWTGRKNQDDLEGEEDAEDDGEASRRASEDGSEARSDQPPR